MTLDCVRPTQFTYLRKHSMNQFTTSNIYTHTPWAINSWFLRSGEVREGQGES